MEDHLACQWPAAGIPRAEKRQGSVREEETPGLAWRARSQKWVG